MSGLAPLLVAATSEFADLQVPFALVGGLAVSVRTEPRFTRDVDLAVSVSSEQDAQRVVSGFRAAGWSLDEALEHEPTQRLAAVRLRPPGGSGAGRVLDLLFASSGVEPELVAEAELLRVLPEVQSRVATVPFLIVLKLLARGPDRPQDDIDLRALVSAASPADHRRARDIAGLVTDRGFDRGRDLGRSVDRIFGSR